MRRFAHHPTIVFAATAAIATLLLSGCDGDGGPLAPAQGRWLGDHVYFEVEADAVRDLRPLAVSCEGERGNVPCTARLGALPDDPIPIQGGAFAATFAEVTVAGRFTSATRAEGTIDYAPADGCCTASVPWAADFRPPQFADAGGGGADAGGTDDASAPPGDGGALPGDLTPAQRRAVTLTNEWRERLSLPPLRSDPAIHRAAQAHADYYVANCDLIRAERLSAHAESPDHDGYTGASFFDRMRAQGWGGFGGWEVMAFGADPDNAIDAWLQTLYHRIPFVHPNATATGYGAARGGGANCGSAAVDVMDFERGGATTTAPVRFPPDGYAPVPTSWHGRENPQPPLPDGASYPSGPIVTLTWPDGGAIAVTDHRLAGPDGGDVPHVLLTPADDAFLDNTVALYAHDPLAPDTTWTVTIEGSRGGTPFVESWTFTTGE